MLILKQNIYCPTFPKQNGKENYLEKYFNFLVYWNLHFLFLSMFLCSFEHLKAKDANFEQRYANLGNINLRQGITEFNWDSNVEDALSTDH